MRRIVMNLAVVVAVLGSMAALPGQASCGWGPVGSGVSASAYGIRVGSLEAFDDGTGLALYAGGDFGIAGGVPATGIAMWDGTTWSAVGGGVGGSAPPSVRALTVYDDGNGPALYAGGYFEVAGGVMVNHIAKWDGIQWTSLNGGVSNTSTPVVRALAVYDDGTGAALYAGGYFTAAGGVSANNIAKWDGTTWSALGTGVTGGWNPGVRALAVFDDGTGEALYAGGTTFSSAGAVSADRIAKWDGIAWTALGSGIGGVDRMVSALATFDDGGGPALYAGGNLTMAGGIPANFLAKWDGVSWQPLPSQVASGSNAVNALFTFDDGGGSALYAGGYIPSAGGITVNNIGRWDGASWMSLSSGMPGGNHRVNAIATFDDGMECSLIAGGYFASAGGVAANEIAKWSCGSTISLDVTQASTGAPVFVNNANLTPYREYYNVFSMDLCPAGPGTGPVAGLCITSPWNIQFVTIQMLSPVGAIPFHFIPVDHYVNWGPMTVPPVALDALCVDVTGGFIGEISPAVRITVQ